MELVIAEKPSVAQSIAAVLGATQRKDGYLEGNEYLVSWCVGHLVELAQPESYEEAWKKWSYESLPIIPQEWQHEVKSDTKAQYQILKKLMHDDRVDAVVCATDAGREGELIFRLTYNMAGCRKPMKRLWISSMEESAIRDGFHNLRPGSDYDNLYHSALCRQEADWLVGINGTRLFTVLYGGKALKVGRVQTPTLAMLVDRESKIMNFKKEAYYMAHIMENGLDAVSEHISDKTEAERIAGACENGQALVTSVIKEEKWVAPPKLYDLTTLQRDANRLFGFTAKQTLEYTQSLYEKKLVTYPRTDSQYLSDDMEGTAKNVIEAIFNSLLFEQNIIFNPDIKRILNSKKVTDHHAIIPTMEIIKQDLKAERERREAVTRAEGEKKAKILEAEGAKESAILRAEADKQAAILRAEAEKEKMIREAEGEAEAILKVQQANADGIKMLKEAGADAAVLKLKSLEAFEKVADGQATTILLPAELQGIASIAETFKAAAGKKAE